MHKDIVIKKTSRITVVKVDSLNGYYGLFEGQIVTHCYKNESDAWLALDVYLDERHPNWEFAEKT